VGALWVYLRYDRQARFRLATVPALAYPTDSVATPPRLPPATAGRPRRVILVIGDGMGLAAIAAARIALHGPDGRLLIERLPSTALVVTHTVDDLITSSDAAATALASGHKTRNGRLGEDLDGQPLLTLLEAARDAGMATGLVTNAQIWDATPAAFAAHQAVRNAPAAIANDLLASRVDVLIGGGAAAFLPQSAGGLRSDGRDLTAEAQATGYRLVRDAAGLGRLAAAPPPRLLALLADDVIPRSAEPPLAAMASAALATLSAGDRPFFLLLESERTDDAGHRNDSADLVAAVAELDAAAATAVAFAQEHGDTLVVVTADHETGGLAIDHGGQRDGQLHLLWSTRYHTGVPVPLFAWGPGADRFTGVLDNTEVPGLLGGLLGIAIPPSPHR
jgi:alkaline phosphatase